MVLCFLAISVSTNAQYSENDLIKEANTLFEKKEYAKAMPLFAQLLALNGSSPEYNFKYGATALYGDADKKEDAIKHLRYASTKFDIDPLCWYFLGKAYHLNYRFADAIHAYNKFKVLAGAKDSKAYEIDRKIEDCQNGKNLLANIKEVSVLDKKQSQIESFFRLYDLSEIGGRILVTPEELLTPLDKRMNHKSLIHYRGTGTTVYFSSYGRDGKTGLDIYSAEVLPDGKFSTPVLLGPTINTPFDEDFPFLHPDNQSFYFSSKGHSSMGGYDIFKSEIINGVFSTPENLDFAINTPDDDFFYVVDSSKTRASFASSRSSKQGEVHVYNVLVSSIPAEITFVKGNFVNQIIKSNKLAKITVIDAGSNKEIDMQYTDPQTGEYVLSFPRSGRYKIVVEADKSDYAHNGIVDIPKSSGVKAYLQEMELVTSAGVEKLIINNRFDQLYDGDISALAQNLLKQRAELDINFRSQPKPTDEPIEEVVENSIDVAYLEAGFPAGMSNENILDYAQKRSENLKAKQQELNTLHEAAKNEFFKALASANVEAAAFQDMHTQAVEADHSEKGNRMFAAGMAKMKAETALREAENLKALIEEIENVQKQLDVAAANSQLHVEEIKNAIESKDFDEAVSALKEEKERRENEDRLTEEFDAVRQMQFASIEAQKEARRYMDRAVSMRNEANEVENKLMNKQTLRNRSKGREAKALDEEIAQLTVEVDEINQQVNRAFNQATRIQEKAFDKNRQFEMMANLKEEISEQGYQNKNTQQHITDISLSELSSQINDLPIDKETVSQYLKNNPSARSEFASVDEERKFRQTYLGTSETDVVKDEVAHLPKGDTQLTDTSHVFDGDVVEDEVAHLPKGDTQHTDTSQVFEGDVVEEEAAHLPKGDTQLTDTSQVFDGDVVEDEAAHLPKGETADAYTDMQQKIADEESGIAEAEDWISIINENIEQLKNSEEEDEGQIAQFEKLKLSKEQEISERQQKILELRADEVNHRMLAVQKAEEDVDSLSVSLISRLEMYNADVVSSRDLQVRIGRVDGDYLQRLGEAEMSGLSDPEIASQRVKINENFIVKVDEKLNQPGLTPKEADELLELRRMKTIELRQDRNIEMGLARYEPRSKEAIEYAAILDVKEDEEIDAVAVENSDFQELSPAMAQELSTPYARERLVNDYDDRKSQIEKIEQPEKKYAERLALNKQLFKKLQSEIELYRSVQQIEFSEENTALISSRYQTMIRDRNALADEIQNDTDELENLKQVAKLEERPAHEPDEVFLDETADSLTEEEPEAIEADVSGADDDYEEQRTFDYVQYFVDQYDEGVLEIETADTNEPEQLEKLAQLNEAIALEIDSTINVLVAMLDDPASNINRDEVQVQIHSLDPIAADKRQEADRLRTQADAVAQQEAISELVNKPENDKPEVDIAEIDTALEVVPTVQIEDVQFTETAKDFYMDEEELTADWDEPFDTRKIKYKSLDANVNLNAIKPLGEEIEAEKLKAKQLFEEINDPSATASDRELARAELNRVQSRISQLQATVQTEVAVSNAAEIAFLTAHNEETIAALRNVNSVEIDGDSHFSKNKTLIERQQQIEAQFLNDEISLKERNEAEMELISQFLELNEDIHTDARRVGLMPDKVSSISAGGVSRTASVIDVMSAMIEVPENKMPEPGKTYVTPIHNYIYTSLTEDRKLELAEEDSNVAIDYNFVLDATHEVDKDLIMAKTDIDEKGILVLRENKNQEAYLLASLKADSLKHLEKRQADFAAQMAQLAIEKQNEANRLRGMIAHEPNERTKKDMEARVSRINAEAMVHYEKSAMAGYQAEKLRNLRREQELEIAQFHSQLNSFELAEVQAILGREPYVVIPSDFDSRDLSAERVPKPKITEEPIQEVDEMVDRVEEVEMVKTVEPSLIETDVETSHVRPEDYVPVNENLGTIDEQLLLEAHGNWLNVFEVIAYKDDFSDIEEGLFVKAEGSIYTNDKPIPINPAMPSGLVFQVQVGAFRNAIPQDLFGDFAPIMGEEIGNGITRYRAGIFKAYKNAIDARNEIRQRGYADAFVVAYHDGERLTGSQASHILEQARQMENLTVEETIPEPVAQVKPQDAPVATSQQPVQTGRTDYYNDPEAAQANLVEATTGLFYTVQVGVYSKPVKLDALFHLRELNAEQTATGYIRYTTGRFSNIALAEERKEEAIAKGVTDAFITAYYNGERISVSRAERILKEHGEGVLASDIVDSQLADEPQDDVKYVVIIGSFQGDVPQRVADLFLERSDLKIRRVSHPSGMSIYASPEFDSKSDAEEFLRQCRDAGIDSAQMGKTVNGKITSAE